MVTIREVAADAGVARSTVSYVLSGNKRMSDETIRRVMASVKKLGYRPNAAARALALNRTNVLGPEVVRMVNEFTTKKCAELKVEADGNRKAELTSASGTD